MPLLFASTSADTAGRIRDHDDGLSITGRDLIRSFAGPKPSTSSDTAARTSEYDDRFLVHGRGPRRNFARKELSKLLGSAPRFSYLVHRTLHYLLCRFWLLRWKQRRSRPIKGAARCTGKIVQPTLPTSHHWPCPRVRSIVRSTHRRPLIQRCALNTRRFYQKRKDYPHLEDIC